jgi:hypothetical protein
MSVENQARESPDGGVVQQAEVNNTCLGETTFSRRGDTGDFKVENSPCENMGDSDGAAETLNISPQEEARLPYERGSKA